jgi:hypothetical protein
MARVGPVTEAERQAVIAASPLKGKYDDAVDGDSAYEMLARRKGLAAEPAGAAAPSGGGLGGLLGSIFGGAAPGAPSGGGKGTAPAGRQRMTTGELIVRSAATSIARSVGTQIARQGGQIARDVLRNALGGIVSGR